MGSPFVRRFARRFKVVAAAPGLALLPCLLLSLLPAFGVRADILVLRDGSRVETQGKWETRGRQVVFKTATGTLSAIRASEVDLPASEAATAEALAPKKEEPASRPAEAKKPVLVLTDKDVPKAAVSPEGEPVEGGEAPDAPDAAAPPAAGGKVEVIRSSREEGGGEVAFQITGTLRNNSARPVTNIVVLTTLTVNRGGENRRVYCEAKVEASLAPSAEVDFYCPIRRKDVLSTGMAELFGDAVTTFEVRSTPQAPTPPLKEATNA